MGSHAEPEIRAQIDLICDSDGFRAAPKLAKLLRFLADKTLDGGDQPLGQRLVAESVLDESGLAEAGAAVVVRMQVGRLRRHLAAYYRAEGCHDAIRVEVPKRNYRLRFTPGGPVSRRASPRAADRAMLAVVEFADLGVGPGRELLPRILAGELVVALSPFQGVAVQGPVAPDDAADMVGSCEFSLLGDVHADGEARLSLRLIERRSGMQVWARSLALPLAAGARPTPEGLAALTKVADELADETGVIPCSLMGESATTPLEQISVHEASLAAWRFLMTGSAADFVSAREATAAARQAMPDSPRALMHDAMMRFTSYLFDPDPRARCPREPLELMDRAASLAPGDPTVQVHHGFGLWMARESIGPEAICRGLDGHPASGSFRGLLGSLMVVSAIDVGRGEDLLGEALARAPKPLFWFCHHAALAAFRRGDLDAMRSALARISVRTDPFSLVLRMVAASAGGDHDAAVGLSRTLLDVVPGFPDAGETMLRRLLHDDHVDVIAAALAPLRLGWFS